MPCTMPWAVLDICATRHLVSTTHLKQTLLLLLLLSARLPKAPVLTSSPKMDPNAPSSPVDDYGLHGSDRLRELESGIEQYVRFDRKALFDKIMLDLEATPAEFSFADIGESVVKASIKFDVSALNGRNDQAADFSVIEGAASLSHQDSQESALFRAFIHLDHNYKININDFSSRVISKLDLPGTIGLLDQGIFSAEHVLAQLDQVTTNFKNFEAEMRRNQWCGNFYGSVGAIGRVYGVFLDDACCVLEKVTEKANELRADIAEFKSERIAREQMLIDKGYLLQMEGPLHEFELPAKVMLERVLHYYGLEVPEYTNSFDPLGHVNSSCVFFFPKLKNLQIGSRIAILGQSCSSDEAEEEAAYQALVFFEKHMLTNICDYNFNKRQKIVKAQKKLLGMLSRIIELGDSLETIFGKLMSAIWGKRGLYTLDPSTLFTGPFAAGQIKAFQLCGNGISALDQFSSERFDACELYFEAFITLTWKLTGLEADLLA